MKDSRKGKEVVQYTDTGRIIIQEEDSTSVKPQDSSDEQVLNSSSGNKRVGNAFMHKEKRQRKSEQLETGAKFRSSKARGDVQKPGMPQPFAYIPLHLGYSHGKMDGKSKTGKKNAWRQKRKLSQK